MTKLAYASWAVRLWDVSLHATKAWQVKSFLSTGIQHQIQHFFFLLWEDTSIHPTSLHVMLSPALRRTGLGRLHAWTNRELCNFSNIFPPPVLEKWKTSSFVIHATMQSGPDTSTYIFSKSLPVQSTLFLTPHLSLLSFIAPPTFSFQMFLCPMSLKMQDISEVVTLLCDCGKMQELNKRIGDYSQVKDVPAFNHWGVLPATYNNLVNKLTVCFKHILFSTVHKIKLNPQRGCGCKKEARCAVASYMVKAEPY